MDTGAQRLSPRAAVQSLSLSRGALEERERERHRERERGAEGERGAESSDTCELCRERGPVPFLGARKRRVFIFTHREKCQRMSRE